MFELVNIHDVRWNDKAFEVLFLPSNYKQLMLCFAEQKEDDGVPGGDSSFCGLSCGFVFGIMLRKGLSRSLWKYCEWWTQMCLGNKLG